MSRLNCGGAEDVSTLENDGGYCPGKVEVKMMGDGEGKVWRVSSTAVNLSLSGPWRKKKCPVTKGCLAERKAGVLAWTMRMKRPFPNMDRSESSDLDDEWRNWRVDDP